MTSTRAKCPTCHASYVYQNRTIVDIERDPIRAICQKCHTRMLLSATGEPVPEITPGAGVTVAPDSERLPRVRRLTTEQNTDAQRLVLSALEEER